MFGRKRLTPEERNAALEREVKLCENEVKLREEEVKLQERLKVVRKQRSGAEWLGKVTQFFTFRWLMIVIGAVLTFYVLFRILGWL